MTSVRERIMAARPFAVGAYEANLDEAKTGAGRFTRAP
jgi:hypothetical protein